MRPQLSDGEMPKFRNRSKSEVRGLIQNFRLLDRAQQFRLAQECVFTRDQELKTAFVNLIGVGFGYKAKTSEKTGTQRLVRTPCIIFIVSSKWKRGTKVASSQRLPKYLYAYGENGGTRLLCAIPTDVRPKSHYGRPRPRNSTAVGRPFGVKIDRAQSNEYVLGALTCAVFRPAVPTNMYILSCRHVFSRSLKDGVASEMGYGVQNWKVQPQPLGKTVAVRGSLDESPLESFDAQLALVVDPSSLKKTLGSLQFDVNSPFASGPDDIEDGFWIATPRATGNGSRLLVWATFHGFIFDHEIEYNTSTGPVTVRHEMLIHATIEVSLLEGDSGSPGIRTKSGNRLMGMFIASSGNVAYLIPAWQLFSPANYGRASEADWELISA